MNPIPDGGGAGIFELNDVLWTFDQRQREGALLAGQFTLRWVLDNVVQNSGCMNPSLDRVVGKCTTFGEHCIGCWTVENKR